MKRLLLCFALTGCGALGVGGTPAQRIGQGMQDAAPLVPAPFNYLLYGAGALVAAYGGHKVSRHVAKKQAAKP